MDRLTVIVKEGNRKDECFIPGNKNAIEKVEYICEGERWESEEYKGKAVDKLAEYEDLEEQNRLIKLPCAVGDKIYLPNEYVGKVIDFEIIEICIFKEEIIFIDDSENEYFINDFGKTVFLTREEAEAALKELLRSAE